MACLRLLVGGRTQPKPAAPHPVKTMASLNRTQVTVVAAGAETHSSRDPRHGTRAAKRRGSCELRVYSVCEGCTAAVGQVPGAAECSCRQHSHACPNACAAWSVVNREIVNIRTVTVRLRSTAATRVYVHVRVPVRPGRAGACRWSRLGARSLACTGSSTCARRTRCNWPYTRYPCRDGDQRTTCPA